MAQPSLMELSTRVERAAVALRAADRAPTAAQLVVVVEDVGRACSYLARAVDRWSGLATRLAAAVSADGEPARDGLRQLAVDLNRCQDDAVAARDALLDLGRHI